MKNHLDLTSFSLQVLKSDLVIMVNLTRLEIQKVTKLKLFGWETFSFYRNYLVVFFFIFWA